MKMQLKHPLFIFLILFSIILACMFNAYLLLNEIHKPKLPVLGQVQPFSLLDSSDKKFGSKELTGKIWVANFFFTSCGDICPRMTKNMAALNRSFELVKGISFVSFSVNPETDSPQILTQYAKKYTANTNRWHFLTGSREKITEIAVKSFKVGSIDEPIFHSAYFSLVDRNGLIRGYYQGTEQEAVNKLFHDTALLLKEK